MMLGRFPSVASNKLACMIRVQYSTVNTVQILYSSAFSGSPCMPAQLRSRIGSRVLITHSRCSELSHSDTKLLTEVPCGFWNFCCCYCLAAEFCGSGHKSDPAGADRQAVDGLVGGWVAD
jgi:hypothetical protein